MYEVGINPMKDYVEPTVKTYGSVEELSESGRDGGYGEEDEGDEQWWT